MAFLLLVRKYLETLTIRRHAPTVSVPGPHAHLVWRLPSHFKLFLSCYFALSSFIMFLTEEAAPVYLLFTEGREAGGEN